MKIPAGTTLYRLSGRGRNYVTQVYVTTKDNTAVSKYNTRRNQTEITIRSGADAGTYITRNSR